MKNVEEWLKAYTHRRFCFMTGRGTAAIYVALKALSKNGYSGKKVIIPTIISPSVPNSVLYGGYKPIFCDIDLNDFNMSFRSVEKILRLEDDVAGMIVPHLYGYPAKIERFLKIASNNDLFVIEDAAQAMGSEYKGQRVGSFGQVSIFSFGHTKILDCGGGGALLTDENTLAHHIKKEIRKLPVRPTNFKSLETLYRKLYYSLYPLTKENEELDRLFLPLPQIFKKMYIFRVTRVYLKAIAREIPKLEFYIKKRREYAQTYCRLLKHKHIIHPKYKHWHWTPWRYTFLLKTNNQDMVTERVRKKGIHISNWYPPVHRWYFSGRKQDPQLFVRAKYFGKHVINLWVDPSLPKEYIIRSANVLLNVLEEME